MPNLCPKCGHHHQIDACYCDACGVQLPIASVANAELKDGQTTIVSSEPSAGLVSPEESLEAAEAPTVLMESPWTSDDVPEESNLHPETSPPQPEPIDQSMPVNAATVLELDEPEFVAAEPTTLESPQAALIDAETGKRFDLPTQPTAYIGKLNEALPVQIDLSQHPNAKIISRVHAVIHREAEDYYLEDAGSANGTALNGELVKPGARFRKLLKAEDIITLGRNRQINLTFTVND